MTKTIVNKNTVTISLRGVLTAVRCMANTISFGSFFLVFVVVVVVSKFIQTSEDLCSIHLSDSILGSATQIKALFHVVWLHSSGTV